MSNKKEILVTIRKTTTKADGAQIERHNAAIESPVTAAEINTAAAGQKAINAKLCMNLFAGKVSQEIKTAAKAKGGLRKLMPEVSNADANALRVCLEQTPAKLRAAWQTHVDGKKRVHGVTLQAMAKQFADKPEQPSVPFKQRMVEQFDALFKHDRELALSPALRGLHDLACEAGWENPDEANMSV